LIAVLIERGRATLHELDTVYGVEDAYDLLETLVVGDHNRHMMEASRDR
jgi:hypothetical protein